MHPSDKDRQTCLCKIHENLEMMLSKLKEFAAISSDNLDILVGKIACDTDSIDCMYGWCKRCCDKDIELNVKNNIDLNQQVFWESWATKRETRDLKNEK